MHVPIAQPALVLLPALAIAFAGVTPTARASSFVPLGTLAGSSNSEAFGVSADGTTVVGRSSGGGNRPWYWTDATGLVQVAPSGAANATSGSVVVGWTQTSTEGMFAFRWNATDGLQDLGAYPDGRRYSMAADVSADGSVIAGDYRDDSNRDRAFLWTEAGGVIPLAPPDSVGWFANAVSHDGSTVAGRRGSGNGSRAFRWNAVHGMTLLDDLADGIAATALDVSLDGSVVTGWVRAANASIQAARWTPSGLEPLVHAALEEVGWRSFAQAVDGSGDVVAGDFHFEGPTGLVGNLGAFVWTPNTGMQPLSGILDALGVDFTGWELLSIMDVSLDGTTFVGSGRNPSGQREAFLVQLDSIPDVANVPEPGSALLLGLGAAALGVRRRRLAIVHPCTN